MTKPTLDSDRRGVSEVIGSILVFGLVIMLVSLLQVQAIPNANEEVEFEHSQQVRGDFSDLQVAIDKTLDSGRSQSASVQMGMDYPSRLLFYNPPSSSGSLRTTEKRTMTISNVQSDSDAGTFFSKKTNSHVVEYETRSLSYSIGYNELANSPTDIREPAVTYRYENGVSLVSETNLVEGTEINLLAIGGELDTGGVTSQKVEAKPLSAPAKTYPVRETGDPLTIEVPTRLSESKWQDLLGGEPNVVSVDVTPTNPPHGTVGTLTVELKTGIQYTLRTSKVGFGTGGDPDPQYMVPVTSEASDTASVEVRDKFNNPVSGVTLDVAFEDEDGNVLDRTTVTTGTNGRASIERPDTGHGSSAVGVEFTKDFDGGGLSDLEKVTTYFGDDVVLNDAAGSDGSKIVEIELWNPGGERTVESVQLHYITEYRGIQVGGAGATNVVDGPDEVQEVNVLSAGSTTFDSNPTENEGPQPPKSSLSIPAGTHLMELKLDQKYMLRTGRFSNDALAVRVTFYFADGSQGTYDVMLQASDDT